MDRLITVIYRVVSNITGSIRKPVAFCLFCSFQFLNQRNHAAIYDIMHISCNRNCSTCCYTCHRRKTFFSSFHMSVQSVLHHLTNQRKRKHKGKCCHKSTHQIIGNFHSAACKFCKKYCKILSAVIIVDRSFGIPEITGRKCCAAHHGFHKSVIHKLLRSICLRTKSCQICPHKKDPEKQQFFTDNKFCFSRRITLDIFF